MTRMYIQPSWIDAASDHNQWSGGNGQYLGDKSADIATFDKQGRARVGAFSDEAIKARKPKAKQKVDKPITKQSLVESIIPQEKRYANLEAKLTQLEKNKHLMTFEEYSELRILLERKLSRQWQLIEKARGWEQEKPNQKKALSREILSENKRSALKAKEPKVKAENVKHDRKSLSKVAEFLAKNDWATFTLASIILFIGTQIIF